MSLATNIGNLATRIATECKSLRTLLNGNAVDLSALNTTAKGNLVAAINEVNATASGGGVTIDDTTLSTTSVYSSSKTEDRLATIKNEILDGAPEALDTLKELADKLGDDDSAISAITTALTYRLRFDDTQNLTAAQKTQGQTNLGVYGTSDIGDPTTNFVTGFEAGLAS